MQYKNKSYSYDSLAKLSGLKLLNIGINFEN